MYRTRILTTGNDTITWLILMLLQNFRIINNLLTAVLRRLKRKLSQKKDSKSDEPTASTRDVSSASRDDVTSPRAVVQATDATQVPVEAITVSYYLVIN